MREVLFNEITNSNILDTDKYSIWHTLHSIEYDISYLSITDNALIDTINSHIDNDKSLNDILSIFAKELNAPLRQQVTLFNIDNRNIREKLFSQEWNIGQVFGPVKTDDNITMYIEIKGKRQKLNVNPNSRIQTKKEIDELIVNYVQKIMNNMEFTLNPIIYSDFIELIKIWYSEIEKIRKHDNYKPSLPEISTAEILITINKEVFSVNDVIGWMNIHPLVFRDGYYKELPYSEQIKFALADLIIDRELNKVAFDLQLDHHPAVEAEYNTWVDNFHALQYRDQLLDNETILSGGNVHPNLNKLFISLAQMKSDKIFINVDLLDSITLSRIDMITYNKTGPYRLVVPQFPIITDHHQLNYGHAIMVDINE